MNIFETELIDERNQILWEELNKTHSINVEYVDSPNYSCYSKNNSSTIYVSKNDIDINSFTHELLHVLIRQKQIFFGSSFKMLVDGNEILSKILSEELLEHLGNCMDHIKMLPIYLELGFDKKKFITDYEINKCTKSEIQQLKDSFKIRGQYFREAISFYIGKYIAIKADPKKHINYPKSLAELKALDSNLFRILEKCIEDWGEMPLEQENIWDDDYHSISSEFYQGLSEWTNGKTFI